MILDCQHYSSHCSCHSVTSKFQLLTLPSAPTQELPYSATAHAIFPYISLRLVSWNSATFPYILANSATIPYNQGVTSICSKALFYDYPPAKRFNCRENCAVASVWECHTPIFPEFLPLLTTMLCIQYDTAIFVFLELLDADICCNASFSRRESKTEFYGNDL